VIAEVGFFLCGLHALVVNPLAPLGQRSNAVSRRNFLLDTRYFLLVPCGPLCHNNMTFSDGHP
jgi:hypothetical protein